MKQYAKRCWGANVLVLSKKIIINKYNIPLCNNFFCFFCLIDDDG